MFLNILARRCKLRWANIRDTMRKKLKDRLRNPEHRSKCYRFEDELAFMLPYYKDCAPDNDYSDLFDDTTEVQMPSEVYIEETLNMDDDDDFEVKPILTFHGSKSESSKSNFNPVPSQQLSTSDPVDVFIMTIRNTMKNFSPYYLNQAKSKIFQTVQDCELKQIEGSN